MVLLGIQNSPNRLFFNKTFQYLFLIVTLSSLTACATPYTKVYEGPDLVKTEVAILSGEEKGKEIYSENPGWVSIIKVDGKELGGVWEGRPTVVHLLPGKRVIEARYESPMPVGILFIWFVEKWRPHFEKTLELDAAPGHEYVVKFHKYTNGSVWMTRWKDVVYWIEESKTGKLVSGQVPDFESDEPRPPLKCPSVALCSEATKSYFRTLPTLE